MEDHHKELEGELELDDSEVLALTQVRDTLHRYTELVNQGMDADFATVTVIVAGVTPTFLRDIREVLVDLFDIDESSKLTLARLCEMEVKLVGVDGAQISLSFLGTCFLLDRTSCKSVVPC
jgi:hypothetical protein